MLSKNRSNNSAFFDLDLTLTDKDSFRLFLKAYYFKNMFNMVYLPYVFYFGLLRKLRLISLKRFKEQALIGLKNKSMDEIRSIGASFFEHHLKTTLREKAIRRIEKHRNSGDFVFIASASPDIYVRAVSRYLNCDGYICSNLALDGTIFTGMLKGEDCIGKEKARRLKRLAEEFQIDLDRSFAYSDHEADLPFLEAAGTRTAVSPTKILHTIACGRGWEIEHW